MCNLGVRGADEIKFFLFKCIHLTDLCLNISSKVSGVKFY